MNHPQKKKTAILGALSQGMLSHTGPLKARPLKINEWLVQMTFPFLGWLRPIVRGETC